MGKILSGKEVAKALQDDLIIKVKILKNKGLIPSLCIVIVGDKFDSVAYIKGTQKRCSAIGINCKVEELPGDTSQEEFLSFIRKLNNDENIHGILIMRPLPHQISENTIKYVISPEKDVDCFNPINASKVMSGEEGGFAPCTPAAVIEILNYYNIAPKSKKAVVIGRSMVVGRPVAMMLLKKHATVTVCHTKTADLSRETQQADILVAAAGKAKMVNKEMVKPGAVVIDVGINFDEKDKMCGDVDYEEVSQIAGMITPIPGGVGSVTSTILVKHVIQACKNQNKV